MNREDKDFLQELHNEELKAFRALQTILERHHIRYFAIGGTLIGAVRHKGFIPWDDDIDIAVPRYDYERLLSVIFDELPAPFVAEDFHSQSDVRDMQCYFLRIRSEEFRIVEVLTEETANSYKDPSRKGFFIDIIPLDGTPNLYFARKIYYAKAMWLRFLGGASHAHSGIRNRRPLAERLLLGVIRQVGFGKNIDTGRIYGRMDRLFKKHSPESSRYSGTITGIYKTREIVPSTLWGLNDPPLYLPFEDLMIRVPAKYHEYLTVMFGNYMIPPANAANSAHYKRI